MADTKQAQLNGAYYGPSIPPEKSYHRPGRGRGCGGGCFCCLLSLVWKLMVAVVVILGLAALIVWLIFRPNQIKFHVTDASLTQFNLTTTTTTNSSSQLHYNLALNMTIRNPNKKIGVYYDRIEARAYYEDQRFSTVVLEPTFYQGHKNTSSLSPTFKGQSLVVFGASELSEFNEEKVSGVYSIDVKLYLRIRFKYGKIKTPKFKPRIKCELEVPLKTSSSVAVGTFKATKCDIDF